jgi:UPF0042 nucleotide-binding protein
MSFGYKEGQPPLANLVFDVRFLKNPFWVEELKPLTGLDKPVQDYVLQQPLAKDFLAAVIHMLETLLPRLEEQNISDFTIAFGCTGGQHRSATLVEALASQLTKMYPHYRITRTHRELEARQLALMDGATTCGAAQQLKTAEE